MPSELADKAEIWELKHQYCYAMDEVDIDWMQSIFAEDGHLDVPIYENVTGHDGIREYFEWYREQDFGTSVHSVSNPLIEIDGDTASGRWYYTVTYAQNSDDLIHGIGAYDDEYVRTDDGWKLSSVVAKRRITRELSASRTD